MADLLFRNDNSDSDDGDDAMQREFQHHIEYMYLGTHVGCSRTVRIVSYPILTGSLYTCCDLRVWWLPTPEYEMKQKKMQDYT